MRLVTQCSIFDIDIGTVCTWYACYIVKISRHNIWFVKTFFGNFGLLESSRYVKCVTYGSFKVAMSILWKFKHYLLSTCRCMLYCHCSKYYSQECCMQHKYIRHILTLLELYINLVMRNISKLLVSTWDKMMKWWKWFRLIMMSTFIINATLLDRVIKELPFPLPFPPFPLPPSDNIQKLWPP